MSRMHYLSTPKDFKTFDSLRELKYNGNMLILEERCGLYWDHTKVIVEMADAYKAFARCLFFNPEMTEKYQSNITRYTAYYTDIIRGLDIFLQEDHLMRTRLRFPLVPVPTYLPSMHEMEHSTVRKIEETAFTKTKQIEDEMLIIMEEHQESREPYEVA